MKKSTKRITEKKSPARKSEVPVTQKMLLLVRDELKSDTSALEHKMEARFDKLTSEVHRLALLIEEQNARSAIVLDGLTNLFERQDRVEKRLNELG